VLLTTFSRRLALALQIKLKRLLDQDPETMARITIAHVDGIGHRLHEMFFGIKPNVASASQVEAALATAAKQLGEERFSRRFLLAAWRTVIDAWQLKTWDEYRDVSRLGRRTRIGGKQREALWFVFERARAAGQQGGGRPSSATACKSYVTASVLEWEPALARENTSEG
jgi:hypothetical protein